jgi:hypothetical protein
MNRAMDWDQFQRLSERGNFIPVYQQWPADLDTPVSAWYRVCRGQPYSFLLEVPPSGGSLEIGNYFWPMMFGRLMNFMFPLRGDP